MHENDDPFTVSPADAQTFLRPAELYAMRDAIARADPHPIRRRRNRQPQIAAPVNTLMSVAQIRQQLSATDVQHRPVLNPQQMRAQIYALEPHHQPSTLR